MTESDLAQFSGSENWYRHSLLRKLVYTDGVKYMADNAGAYWLIDLIASHQFSIKSKMAKDFQLWTLVRKDKGCVVECFEDSGRPAIIRQEVEYTDFPFNIRLYLERGSIDGISEALILMLPQER